MVDEQELLDLSDTGFSDKRIREIMEREKRRQEAERQFDLRPRGARTRAHKDLDVAMTTITGVLTGRLVNDELLARLEAWLAEHPAEE